MLALSFLLVYPFIRNGKKAFFRETQKVKLSTFRKQKWIVRVGKEKTLYVGVFWKLKEGKATDSPWLHCPPPIYLLAAHAQKPVQFSQLAPPWLVHSVLCAFCVPCARDVHTTCTRVAHDLQFNCRWRVTLIVIWRTRHAHNLKTFWRQFGVRK